MKEIKAAVVALKLTNIKTINVPSRDYGAILNMLKDVTVNKEGIATPVRISNLSQSKSVN